MMNMSDHNMIKSKPLLSKLATNDQHGENSSYFDGWKAYNNDPFHPINNPNGVIQMGLAENQLSTDLIEEWIKEHPEASICSNEGVGGFKDVALYQDYHGLPEFRSAIAKMMGNSRKGMKGSCFDEERIVMAGGATGANETLMFCLANPGDAFLIPTPYYPGFDRDLSWRTRVRLLPITCRSSNNFQITKQALEEAYENAQKANIRVKGIIVTNPSNPLGTTMDRATLTSLVAFATDKSIHLVCDEIYASTVFRAPDFISVAEIIEQADCNRDLIHIVYSLSKDMGLPGFRVGIIYSYNDSVVDCARKMSSFGLVSSQTQRLLASMLSDEEFIGRFLSESGRRLAERHRRFTAGLAEVGVGCVEGNAGLFCWMDLRSLLKEFTFGGELELWRVIVGDVKLNVSPGASFHCHEPGWFRVCFANMDDETVEVALGRIRKFVGRGREGGVREKKLRRKELRLSFSSFIRDSEMAQSPRAMSPRSPLLSART